jgi:hypothetical protein
LAAVLFVAVAAVCGAQQPVESHRPTRWIVGVDRSASRTTQQMREMQQFATALTDLIGHGDEFTIIETFRARSDSVRQWRGSLKPLRVPPTVLPSERRSLQSFRGTARYFALKLTDTTGHKAITSTDIIGLLRRVAEYARSGDPKRTVVVLLSDMRQSTPDLDMDRPGQIPNQAWVDKQRASGLIPEVAGACIVAVGAPIASPRDLAVRRFWTSYFGAARARFDEAQYRTFMTPGDIKCQ